MTLAIDQDHRAYLAVIGALFSLLSLAAFWAYRPSRRRAVNSAVLRTENSLRATFGAARAQTESLQRHAAHISEQARARAEELQHRAAELAEEARNRASILGEQARHRAEELQQRAAALREQARQRANEFGMHAVTRAEELRENAADLAMQIRELTTEIRSEIAKDHPHSANAARIFLFDGRFRYFAHPHRHSSWSAAPRECELCGRARPGYNGSFYGDEELEFVCEPCLGSGRLAAHGAEINDFGPELEAQINARYAHRPAAERHAMLRERIAELTERTPMLPTWHELPWPVHCADFMRFERPVGRRELDALAVNGNGLQYFIESLPSAMRSETPIDRVWAGAPLDAPVAPGPLSAHPEQRVGLYLFRCLSCREIAVLWDAEWRNEDEN